MRLSQYLKKTGLTLSELARQLGVPRSTLQDIRDEKKGASATTARKIILGTSGLVGLDDLIAKRPRPKRVAKSAEESVAG